MYQWAPLSYPHNPSPPCPKLSPTPSDTHQGAHDAARLRVTPGTHRTCQRCSGRLRPSEGAPARSVQSKPPPAALGAVLTGRNGPGRARTVANRAGTALTGAVRTGPNMTPRDVRDPTRTAIMTVETRGRPGPGAGLTCTPPRWCAGCRTWSRGPGTPRLRSADAGGPGTGSAAGPRCAAAAAAAAAAEVRAAEAGGTTRPDPERPAPPPPGTAGVTRLSAGAGEGAGAASRPGSGGSAGRPVAERRLPASRAAAPPDAARLPQPSRRLLGSLPGWRRRLAELQHRVAPRWTAGRRLELSSAHRLRLLLAAGRSTGGRFVRG